MGVVYFSLYVEGFGFFNLPMNKVDFSTLISNENISENPKMKTQQIIDLFKTKLVYITFFPLYMLGNIYFPLIFMVITVGHRPPSIFNVWLIPLYVSRELFAHTSSYYFFSASTFIHYVF